MGESQSTLSGDRREGEDDVPLWKAHRQDCIPREPVHGDYHS